MSFEQAHRVLTTETDASTVERDPISPHPERLDDQVDAGSRSDVVIDLRDPAETSLPGARFIRSHEGLVGAGFLPRSLKRVIDVSAAGTLLLFLAPVMVLVALLVRMTSRGPALFRQSRVGRDGESFEMIKFRTMYCDAEERRSEIEALNEQTGPVFKMRRDPRVTPLGFHLRRWSLDELPQLFNVLAGSMSMVGPRPPLPDEVRAYSEWEAQRLLVKPGLTCTWQVNGRSEVDFRTWVEMDIDYIANWSVAMDLKLMARTLPAVIDGEGAY